MSIESLSLRTPPQYDLQVVENPELPPSTSNHDNVPQLNVHQLNANYHGPNYGHWAQHRDNLWYQGPPPPAANLELEGQYNYQVNLNAGHAYPQTGNAHHYLAAPDPPLEYHIPPAQDLPNDGVGDRPPPTPDVANAFHASVPEPAPSRMLVMESLKRLADRYLNDPGAQVDTLRMGLSPSDGRLRVMIVLDIDI